MKIDLQNASNIFFNENISLENMYFEAITNSIDAGASEISLSIHIDNIKDIAKSLTIQISDNGVGFNDNNYDRFCKLLSPVDKEHKGIGRLIYLQYFMNIDVESSFDEKKRTFKFDKDFDANNYSIEDINSKINKTVLSFNNYQKSKVANYSYLIPRHIKLQLINHILPKLYEYQSKGKIFEIKINSNVPIGKNKYSLVNDNQTITPNDAPALEKISLDIQLNNMIPNDKGETTDKFIIKYSIIQTHNDKTNVSSMAVIDNRTIKLDLVNSDNLPRGFNFIILIESDYYNNKADNSRTKIKYSNPADENIIGKSVLNKLGEIIYLKYPHIKKAANETEEKLKNKFPHLSGLFDFNSIEFNLDKILSDAQNKFFNKQKKLLLKDAELDDNDYRESLEISSRILLEYILFRNVTIDRLRSINFDNSEEDIHNIICPMREKFTKETINDNIFRNNIWLLDDKFMSYSSIFSDIQINNLYSELDNDNNAVSKDIQRPDIAIVFNKDPASLKENEKVDVVIVELKKLGLNLYKTRQVIEDLKDRARRLIRNYDHKIQRIWFYGIVDITPEFENTLKEERYIKLYSSGKSFYKDEVIIPIVDDNYEVPIQLFITSFDTFIKDAEHRNQAFMEVIKSGFKHK